MLSTIIDVLLHVGIFILVGFGLLFLKYIITGEI